MSKNNKIVIYVEEDFRKDWDRFILKTGYNQQVLLKNYMKYLMTNSESHWVIKKTVDWLSIDK